MSWVTSPGLCQAINYRLSVRSVRVSVSGPLRRLVWFHAIFIEQIIRRVIRDQKLLERRHSDVTETRREVTYVLKLSSIN